LTFAESLPCLVPGSKPDFVRMSRQAKNEKEPLSIICFYPFLPTNSVPLVNDLPPDADGVWALVPLDHGTGAPAERDLSVRMVPAAGGEEVPIDWELIDAKKSEAGNEFLLVGIVFPDLRPGAYKLGFSLKDAKTGETLAAEANLVKK